MSHSQHLFDLLKWWNYWSRPPEAFLQRPHCRLLHCNENKDEAVLPETPRYEGGNEIPVCEDQTRGSVCRFTCRRRSLFVLRLCSVGGGQTPSQRRLRRPESAAEILTEIPL